MTSTINHERAMAERWTSYTTEWHQLMLAGIRVMKPAEPWKAAGIQIGSVLGLICLLRLTSAITATCGAVVILLTMERMLPMLNHRLQRMGDGDQETIHKLFQYLFSLWNQICGSVVSIAQKRSSLLSFSMLICCLFCTGVIGMMAPMDFLCFMVFLVYRVRRVPGFDNQVIEKSKFAQHLVRERLISLNESICEAVSRPQKEPSKLE